MAFQIERSRQADRDLRAIFDFLFESGLSFGEAPPEAFARASKRIVAIEKALHHLAKAPYQGTLHPELLPGLRSVTKERAIIYFLLDDARETLRILALFFGGQDHQRAMVKRILTED